MSSKIKLTFLGTSASIPTSKRNSTGILLNYKSENILIDCGEGIQRQIRKAKLNPCKISKILITHWHGDHVLGLPGLFQTLTLNECNHKIDIFGPKGIKNSIGMLTKIFSLDFKFQSNTKEVLEKGIFFENDDFYLEAEKMEHGVSVNAYNFVVKDKLRIDKDKLKKFKIPAGKHLLPLSQGENIEYNGKKYPFKDLTYIEKGKKISIVLDTKNNSKIIPFVQGADLFICESSFSDSDIESAKDHLHMTSGEAGEIAKKAKVKKLILTHISQRYENKLEVLLEDAKKNFKKVIIAKDLNNFEI